MSEKCDNLQSQLSQYKEVEEIFKNIDTYRLEYEVAKDELKRYKEVHKEISNTWIFYKVRDKLASFSAFYNSLESSGHVPPPIPQSEIKASLEKHTCALCGNHLDEDSECYRNVKAKESNEMIDSMGKAIGKISYAISLRRSDVENVPQAIKIHFSNVEKQENAKAAALQKFKEADGRLKSVQISASDHKAKEDFENKRKLLAANESALEEKRTEKTKLEGCIELLNEEILKAKAEMSSLRRSSSEKINEADQIKLSYASKLASCMTKLRASMQDVAYEEIQKEANDYYHKMAKENPAIIGDIRIDRKNSEIYTVNKQGEKILNINAGSRILIELAVIAGILSIASRRFGMTYPFVTDAPTSHLDGQNKIQTIMCMFQVFDQSLVIIKDDSEKGNEASDSIRKLISESEKIGAAYELEMVVDSKEIEDQYTVVHVLKGVQ